MPVTEQQRFHVEPQQDDTVSLIVSPDIEDFDFTEATTIALGEEGGRI